MAATGEDAALAEMQAWVDCRDECDDPSMHAHFASGRSFVWQWPRFNVYKPADARPRALLNRYPHNVIGAAVVLFGRCWGVVWKGSPHRKPRKPRRHSGSDAR